MPNGRRSAKFDVGRERLPQAAFAECPPLPSAWHSAKRAFTECYTLPSAFHSHALGKYEFAECSSLPSAALGKIALCRVPDIWHSAKSFALGKEAESGSVSHTMASS